MSKALSHCDLPFPPKLCLEMRRSPCLSWEVGKGEGVKGIFLCFLAQIPGCSDHGQNVERLKILSLVVAKLLSRKQGQEALRNAQGLEGKPGTKPVLGKVQIYLLKARKGNMKETQKKSLWIAK